MLVEVDAGVCACVAHFVFARGPLSDVSGFRDKFVGLSSLHNNGLITIPTEAVLGRS